MSEQPHPPPRPVQPAAGWDHNRTFRLTFLSQFTRPEDGAGLRWLTGVLEEGLTTLGQPPDVESCTATHLRAVLGDLRYLQTYLADVGRSREEFHLKPDEIPLSVFAEKLSRQVGTIADKLEARLSPS